MGNATYESVGGRFKKPKPSANHALTAGAAQDMKLKGLPAEAVAPRTEKGEGMQGDEPEPPLRTVEVNYGPKAIKLYH